MKRFALATLALLVLSAPLAVRAEPGSDDHLQPKNWKRSAMTDQHAPMPAHAAAPRSTATGMTDRAELPSAFDASRNAY